MRLSKSFRVDAPSLNGNNISFFSFSFFTRWAVYSEENGLVCLWLCVPQKRGRKEEERLEHAYVSFSFLSGSRRLTYLWRREAVYKAMNCLTLLSLSLPDSSSSKWGESDERFKRMWRRPDVIWDTERRFVVVYVFTIWVFGISKWRKKDYFFFEGSEFSLTFLS